MLESSEKKYEKESCVLTTSIVNFKKNVWGASWIMVFERIFENCLEIQLNTLEMMDEFWQSTTDQISPDTPAKTAFVNF